jgi:glutathionyl-hydroquinone reductase
MGELVEGVWKTGWYDPDARGAFQRPQTKFRSRITASGELRPEPGRYHLYV